MQRSTVNKVSLVRNFHFKKVRKKKKTIERPVTPERGKTLEPAQGAFPTTRTSSMLLRKQLAMKVLPTMIR